MKRIVAILMLMLLPVSVFANSYAEKQSQVVYAGGSALYNAAGQQVTGSDLGDNDSVVKISKTIEQADAENEFIVTLQVQTSQNLKSIVSDTPDSAVLLVMDVSNSMDDCVHCGKEANDTAHVGTSTTAYYCSGTSGTTYSSRGNSYTCRHCDKRRSQHNAVTTTTSGTCAYQSRLDATKVAAKDFLYGFANESGAQEGDRRMVAIVSYGTHAVRALNWVDISTTNGMYQATQAIDALTIGNGSYDEDLQGGGTSIESGLTLARNLLGMSAVSGIDYRYTILLTDGQPTYPVGDASSTSTSSVKGSTGNSGSSTQEADVNNVPAIAQSIKSTSKLYSICFGKSGSEDVWDLTPFSDWSGSNPSWSTTDNTTVGQWMTSFSNAAYKAQDATSAKLFDTFSSILAQIQVAAKAWKVEDWMGDYIVYGGFMDTSGRNSIITEPNASDYPDGKVPSFVWNLLTSETDPALTNWNESTNTGVLGYSYQYRVTLDNLNLNYQGGATFANDLATLRYATTDAQGNWPTSTEDYESAAFPVPTVEGLYGTLTFTKVNESDQPLANVTFRLRHSPSDAEPSTDAQLDYLEATSDANGVVTFTNIPSGHDYVLLEVTLPEHYVDPGDMPVSVSWGVVNCAKLVDGKLVNTYSSDALGKLSLIKEFAEGSVKPHSIQFTITGPDGYVAHRELNENDEQPDGTWSWTMSDLKPGVYTVKEVNAKDDNGNLLLETHDLTYSIVVDGTTTASNVDFTGSNYPETNVSIALNSTHSVKFINDMTRKEGTLSISKTFVDLPEDMVNANMGLTMSVTATPVDEDGVAIRGETPTTLTLGWDGSSFSGSMTLPIGRYRLSENLSGSMEGYTWLHHVFAQNDLFIENDIVTIEGNTTLNLTLRNHFERDHGRIYINKLFGGDLTAEHFTNRVFVVNIRENDANGKIVATLVLDEGDGQYTAKSPLLPVGTYYLEEVVAEDAEDTAFEPGYTHTVTWNPGATVQVTKDTLVNLDLTNSYTQDTGYLQVTKTVNGLPADLLANVTVTVDIFAPDTTTPLASLSLQDGKWSDIIELPLGTYELTETVNAPEDALEDYDHAARWDGLNDDAQIVVTANHTAQAPIVVSVTNDYSKKPGYITLTKEFAGDLSAADFNGKTISVQIMSGNTVVDTLTISGTQLTDTSIALPVGTYTLVETGADVVDYALAQTWSANVGENQTVVVTHGATIAVTLTNTYTNHFGNLTITKKLTGLETQDNTFRFHVTNMEDTAAYDAYVDVEVSTTGVGSTTVKLPVGRYHVEEVLPYVSTDNRYKVSYEANSDFVVVSNDGVITNVTSNEAIAFTCTNTNVAKTSIRIPIQKKVTVTGNTMPGVNTFSFGVEWSNPQNLPIDIRYESSDGNTEGYVVQTARNAYNITVEDDGTVSGYIVITGFADDLDNFVLTTWEKLTPYANAESAKAAHWIYDQTAQDSTLRWTVRLSKETEYKVNYTLSLGQNSGMDKVSFENVYEKNTIPELPQTGDNSQIGLWAAMCLLSMAGILLLRKKPCSR